MAKHGHKKKKQMICKNIKESYYLKCDSKQFKTIIKDYDILSYKSKFYMSIPKDILEFPILRHIRKYGALFNLPNYDILKLQDTDISKIPFVLEFDKYYLVEMNSDVQLSSKIN